MRQQLALSEKSMKKCSFTNYYYNKSYIQILIEGNPLIVLIPIGIFNEVFFLSVMNMIHTVINQILPCAYTVYRLST